MPKNSASAPDATKDDDVQGGAAARAEDDKTEAELWQELEAADTASAGDDDGSTSDASEAKDKDGAGASGDAPIHTEAKQGDPPGNPADDAQSKEAGVGETPAGPEADAKGDGPDPWATAPAELRAAHEEAQAQIKKLEQSDRSNRGRLSTLQRQLNDLSTKQQARETPSGDAGKKPNGKDGQASNEFLGSEKWKAFQTEYPEVAGPIGELISGMQLSIADQGKAMDAIAQDRHQTFVNGETDALEEEHPDWLKLATSAEFPTWLKDQPGHIQAAAKLNATEIVDAAQAADVISRYKAFRSQQAVNGQGPSGEREQADKGKPGSLSGRRQRQLESSSAARSRGPGAAHGIPEDGDEKAIWKMFDEQERRASSRA